MQHFFAILPLQSQQLACQPCSFAAQCTRKVMTQLGDHLILRRWRANRYVGLASRQRDKGFLRSRELRVHRTPRVVLLTKLAFTRLLRRF
jgi:hypothetical protein